MEAARFSETMVSLHGATTQMGTNCINPLQDDFSPKTPPLTYSSTKAYIFYVLYSFQVLRLKFSIYSSSFPLVPHAPLVSFSMI